MWAVANNAYCILVSLWQEQCKGNINRCGNLETWLSSISWPSSNVKLFISVTTQCTWAKVIVWANVHCIWHMKSQCLNWIGREVPSLWFFYIITPFNRVAHFNEVSRVSNVSKYLFHIIPLGIAFPDGTKKPLRKRKRESAAAGLSLRCPNMLPYFRESWI